MTLINSEQNKFLKTIENSDFFAFLSTTATIFYEKPIFG